MFQVLVDDQSVKFKAALPVNTLSVSYGSTNSKPVTQAGSDARCTTRSELSWDCISQLELLVENPDISILPNRVWNKLMSVDVTGGRVGTYP